MPTVKGREAVARFIAELPAELSRKVLPGAARAAAKVVAEEAKLRTKSDQVRASVKVTTSRADGRVIGKVQTRGSGAYLAPWEEYGTAPHYISVDDSQRNGMSVGRINRLSKAGTLVINGKPVGATVFHPGARPHPFLRPALDIKEADAVQAAQTFINAHVTRTGITGSVEGDEE